MYLGLVPVKGLLILVRGKVIIPVWEVATRHGKLLKSKQTLFQILCITLVKMAKIKTNWPSAA